MAVTARTWVPAELVTAAKMNTLRDDILELDAVAGFFDAQYGTITVPADTGSADATVSAMSSRAVVHFLGGDRPEITSGIRLSKVNSTTVRATKKSSGAGTAEGTVAFVIQDPRG